MECCELYCVGPDVLRSAVSDIVHFPGYNDVTVDGDFSLLRLSTAVNFTAFPHIRPVRTAPLPLRYKKRP